MPTTAMSAEPTSSRRGSWANVGTPAYRGTRVLSSCPTWSPASTRGSSSGTGLPLPELVDRLPLRLPVAEDLTVGRRVRVLDDGGYLRLASAHPAGALGSEGVARLRRDEEHGQVERAGEADRARRADAAAARRVAERALDQRWVVREEEPGHGRRDPGRQPAPVDAAVEPVGTATHAEVEHLQVRRA